MSGGHFDYVQYQFNKAADDLENYLDNIGKRDADYNPQYSDATKLRMKEAISKIREAAIYLHRIDYLISCDDGEETFHERLTEELIENESQSS